MACHCGGIVDGKIQVAYLFCLDECLAGCGS